MGAATGGHALLCRRRRLICTRQLTAINGGNAPFATWLCYFQDQNKNVIPLLSGGVHLRFTKAKSVPLNEFSFNVAEKPIGTFIYIHKVLIMLIAECEQ